MNTSDDGTRVSGVDGTQAEPGVDLRTDLEAVLTPWPYTPVGQTKRDVILDALIPVVEARESALRDELGVCSHGKARRTYITPQLLAHMEAELARYREMEANVRALADDVMRENLKLISDKDQFIAGFAQGAHNTAADFTARLSAPSSGSDQNPASGSHS